MDWVFFIAAVGGAWVVMGSGDAMGEGAYGGTFFPPLLSKMRHYF